MGAATQLCWFTSLARLETHIPTFPPSFHLSLKEKISLKKFLYLNYEDPHPPALLLHLRLQFDSKQKGCHADLKEQ